MSVADPKAKAIKSRWGAMLQKRSKVDPVWDECARFCLPHLEHLSQGSDPDYSKSPLDATGIDASEKLASNLFSHTVAMGRQWFGYRSSLERHNESETGKRYFAESSKGTLKAIQNSNFSMIVDEDIRKLPVFGTNVLFCDFDVDRHTLNFESWPIQECCVEEDATGRPNRLYRERTYTAANAHELWGDKCSDDLIKAATTPGEELTEFKFIEVVEQRAKGEYTVDPENTDPLAYRFSHDVVQVDGDKLVMESGYKLFPFAIPRLGKIPGTPYGRSNAMNALPSLRLLNTTVADVIDAIEAELRPVVFGPEDIDPSEVCLKPGSYNPILSAEFKSVETWTPKVKLQVAQWLMERADQSVRDLFFVDLFMMLEQRRNMTATEVEQRMSEKIQTLAPLVARLQAEYFGPILELAFALLIDHGVLDAPPEEFGSAGYTIEYTTRLDSMLKEIETSNLLRAVDAIAKLAATSREIPELEDIVDIMKASREICYNFGVEVDFIRPRRESEKRKKGREEQSAAQAAAEFAAKNTKPIDLQAEGAPDPTAMMAEMAGGLPNG